ncbi:DEAD/DEAH box helicase family protein [Plantactinospora sonchi]|uniref:Uncharacterized protein n=1 Tax=Plantactinospora sonchi TaxID=1544735 RepID=A0ABU7RWZ9_9ACTN
MGISKVAVDPAIAGRLGPDELAALKVNLWPLDCQTCGGRLRRWDTPALVVRADGDLADASLHHRRCHASGWFDRETVPATQRPHLTWRAGTCVLPSSGLPMFLVNPSYEAALLRHVDGRWRVWTVEHFVDLGFSLEMASERAEPIPILAAELDRDRISVEVRIGGVVRHAWRDLPISPATFNRVSASYQIMVGVTTLADVHRPLTEEQISGLMRYQRMALGSARITSFAGPAQPLRASDFDPDIRAETTALTFELVRRLLGVPVTDTHLDVSIRLFNGDDRAVLALDAPDRILAVLPVVLLYACRSHGGSGQPGVQRGVHVMTPDAFSADEYLGMITPIAEQFDRTVGRLGAAPSSPQGAEAYLADVVVGTSREFLTAHRYHLDAGPEWGLHAGRGEVAVITGDDPLQVMSADFVRHYPRLTAG